MKVGEHAPDFELESNTGEKIKLSSYFGKKKIVLFFYVKNNTPGCTAEVKGIRNHHPEISKKYEVFGINQDPKESHADFCQKHDLPFKILSDPGRRVASLYDAKGALGMYTRRTTYLIGLNGKIEKMVEGMDALNHIEFVRGLSNL